MLGEVQRKKIQYLFNIFDVNNNGVLEESDFKVGFIKLAETATVPRRGKVAWRLWWRSLRTFADDDKDFEVNEVEFHCWAEGIVRNLSLTRENQTVKTFKRSLEAIYDCMDVEKNGFITKENFQALLDTFKLNAEGIDVFGKLDANHDGKISRKEFRESGIAFFMSNEIDTPGNYIWGNPF